MGEGVHGGGGGRRAAGAAGGRREGGRAAFTWKVPSPFWVGQHETVSGR